MITLGKFQKGIRSTVSWSLANWCCTMNRIKPLNIVSMYQSTKGREAFSIFAFTADQDNTHCARQRGGEVFVSTEVRRFNFLMAAASQGLEQEQNNYWEKEEQSKFNQFNAITLYSHHTQLQKRECRKMVDECGVSWIHPWIHHVLRAFVIQIIQASCSLNIKWTRLSTNFRTFVEEVNKIDQRQGTHGKAENNFELHYKHSWGENNHPSQGWAIYLTFLGSLSLSSRPPQSV